MTVQHTPTPPRPVLLRAGRIITRPDQPPVERGAVLVEGDRIVAVGPATELEGAASGATVMELPAATVMAGLVNVHVHLSFDVTTDPRPALETGDLATLEHTVRSNARALLDGGVTTARDLGDRDGLVAGYRAQVQAGQLLGPTMLTACSPLTAPEGHCWFLGGEIDLTGTAAENHRAVDAAVARHLAAGADVIKVMTSGGMMTPAGAPMWQSQFSEQDLALIVASAREHGLPVAGHAHGADAMAACAKAGVNTIEHGGWLAPPDADGAMGYAPSEEIAEIIARTGIAVVPTRAREWETWPPEARLDLQLAKLAWNDQHGIRLIAGNDAGVGQGYFDTLVDTITQFHAAGWTPSRALATATTEAAQALGLGSQIGQLTPGYRADLIVLGSNPLEDLHALADIQHVMTGGRLHTPDSASSHS